MPLGFKLRLRRRRGVTLVELLGVMAVIAILSAVAIGGILTSQERARVTSAMSSIDAYDNAFATACITNPGIVGDRYAIIEGGGTYGSQEGLKRLVKYMNETLDDNLDFYWDASMKCYVSLGKDPWGGNFILTEYPVGSSSGADYSDPSQPNNQAVMACAIWCTGNTDSITLERTVSKDCYGIGMVFQNGLGSSSYQGFDDQYNFTDSTITFG